MIGKAAIRTLSTMAKASKNTSTTMSYMVCNAPHLPWSRRPRHHLFPSAGQSASKRWLCTRVLTVAPLSAQVVGAPAVAGMIMGWQTAMSMKADVPNEEAIPYIW